MGFKLKLSLKAQIIQLIYEEKFKRFLKCPQRFVEFENAQRRSHLKQEIKYECVSIGVE